MAAPAPQSRRFTREEYEHLVDKGFFHPEERIELVDGVIHTMTPQSSRHAAAIRLTLQSLRRAYSGGYDFLVQMPLALGQDSEPEPDIAVVPGSPRDYLTSHPQTAVLIIEVADSSVSYDRAYKRDLYAHAGIPEYWLLNLVEKHLEVYRDPRQGTYRSRTILRTSERVSPLSAPEASIVVADLLP
jgi:Uma2 family endonuclease